MKRRLLSVALFVSVFSLPCLPALALNVTLNDGGASFLTTAANDQVNAADQEVLNPPATPYLNSSSSASGATSSDADYSLTNSGFEIDIDQVRTLTLNSFGQAFGSVFFSVDENTNYVATGDYTAVDSDGRRI
ncbi:MAG: hypothetical protein JRG84_18390, partial [Deltaproteobacteria bacterium]|nr:hypothetical protein [Deltaproteobacteria bacterium]